MLVRKERKLLVETQSSVEKRINTPVDKITRSPNKVWVNKGGRIRVKNSTINNTTFPLKKGYK
jgi:hypothetical protein